MARVAFIGRFSDQAEGISKAMECGHTVVACDGYPTHDDLDGALTMKSDRGLLNVARLNSENGATGVNKNNVEFFTDKLKMKELIRRSGANTPDYGTVKEGVKQIEKPIHGCGSNGVRMFGGNPRNDCYVEDYIEGNMAGAEVAVVDGRCEEIVLFGDYCDGFETIGHYLPLTGCDTDEIEKQIEAVVYELDFENGILNFDIILDKDGKPWVIEVNGRMGCNHLPELISEHTGIDWINVAINLAIGKEPKIKRTANKTVEKGGLQWRKTQ